jgi:hypothetical protein
MQNTHTATATASEPSVLENGNQSLQKLEPPQVAIPSVSEFGVMKETASMLVQTGFLPGAIKTPEQAIAIILTGRELGIGTMAALNTINVIQGKPTVSPQLMLALIERSGQLADIQIEPHNGGAVRCTMKRKGRSPHTEIFGDAEAAAMQLSGKDNYKKQKQTMYRWRAVAACARVVFPDVITGLYTPDEMGVDMTEDGELLPPHVPVTETTVELDPESEKHKAAIAEACKTLNAGGDSITWTRATLIDYAKQLFDDEAITDTDEIGVERLQFLAEDLEERLKLLKDNS